MCLKLDKSLFFFLLKIHVACGVFLGVRDSGSFPLDVQCGTASILKFASKSNKAAPAPAIRTTFQPEGKGKGKKRDSPPPLKILQEVVHNVSAYIPLART